MSDVPRTPADAEEFVKTTLDEKPQLMVHTGDLPATARALRDLLTHCEYLFDRDVPVKLIQPRDGSPMRAIPLTANNVVIEAHDLCQPIKINHQGEFLPVTLPDRVARMYLDMGDWNLRPLAGITTAPVLAADGSIRDLEGYDAETGLWCCKVPKLIVPERPGLADAQTALRRLRATFTTFPFADAVRQRDPHLNVDVVDLAEPAGRDESAFLVALLTAVCRPSLWLAPGFLIEAPALSGAGTGKGLLVRAICAIAFGIRPRAFTAGHDRQELEKRIAADLVQAAPALFLDNVNGAVLRSDTLATVITERPARVRIFGELRMAVVNSTAFIAITGNGLTVSEDLARRFISCKLDAACEDPESRPFGPGFLEKVEQDRVQLLSAGLTIWRYGQQNQQELKRGRPLGSFETCCDWVRDPLLTLGCRDPVERVEMLKAHDPYRQNIAELFKTWSKHHRDEPIRASELAEPIRRLIDPLGRGRQYVATTLGKMAGTRAAGFVLVRQDAGAKWGAVSYALHQTTNNAPSGIGHRGHRGHRVADPIPADPMTPMPPMPDGLGDIEHEEEEAWTL
jgi:hypothetical protein